MEVDYGRRRLLLIISIVIGVMVIFFFVAYVLTRGASTEPITDEELRPPVAEVIAPTSIALAGSNALSQLGLSSTQLNYIEGHLKQFATSTENITSGYVTVLPQDISPRIVDTKYFVVDIKIKTPNESMYTLGLEYQRSYFVHLVIRDPSGAAVYSSPVDEDARLDEVTHEDLIEE